MRLRRTRRNRAVADDDGDLIAPSAIRCAALRGGAPFFCCALVPMTSRLRRCALALALQGKCQRHIPAALRLAPLQHRRPGCAGAAIPMPQRLLVHHSRSALHLHDCMGVPGQETWPVALSCFASSRLRRLAPFGLPSFPRSARLTPTARLPASGLRACACRAVQHTGTAVAMSSRLS